MKAKEANRQTKMLSLARQLTSQVSERDYVAQAMSKDGLPDDSFLEDEQKKLERQRDKNIKLLRKQVMALAREELAKA